ncbi:MAG: hypothetical protein ACE5J6_03275 [Candidatus Bathyarchaeia archaeon]
MLVCTLIYTAKEKIQVFGGKLLIEWLRVSFNLIIIVFSLGLSYYGYRLLALFKGGMFESSLKIFAPLPLIVVVFQIFDLLQYLLVKTSNVETTYLASQLLHVVSEVMFIALLFYVLNLFYKKWTALSQK